jgi:hypothetical protein
LDALKREDQKEVFEHVFKDALLKQYVFKVRANQSNVNDELRVKCQAITVKQPEYAVESKKLYDSILSMLS